MISCNPKAILICTVISAVRPCYMLVYTSIESSQKAQLCDSTRLRVNVMHAYVHSKGFVLCLMVTNRTASGCLGRTGREKNRNVPYWCTLMCGFSVSDLIGRPRQRQPVPDDDNDLSLADANLHKSFNKEGLKQASSPSSVAKSWQETVQVPTPRRQLLITSFLSTEELLITEFQRILNKKRPRSRSENIQPSSSWSECSQTFVLDFSNRHGA